MHPKFIGKRLGRGDELFPDYSKMLKMFDSTSVLKQFSGAAAMSQQLAGAMKPVFPSPGQSVAEASLPP